MARTFRSLSFAWLTIAFATVPQLVEAKYGLRATEVEQRVSRDLVAGQLFTELTAVLGHGSSHERLVRLEGLMRPMYMTLPKNKDGGIDQGTSRYALQRYFLKQHGWHIRGLASEGARWNASASTTMLKSKMPSLILELLEDRVGTGHVGLAELAVLAATVEDLVHGETIDLLRMAYETHGFSVHAPLPAAADEELVIKTYLLYFLMPGTQEKRGSSTSVLSHFPEVPEDFPGWEDIVLWVKDLMEGIKYRERQEWRLLGSTDRYFKDFASMVQLAEQIIDGVGMFQNKECKMMKNMLLDLQGQERTDGRVPLDKFWGPFMVEEHWYFTESTAYLKHLGALDDSDAQRPAVILPNIIYGRSNCLATGGFHSLCCVNECEAIMEALERSIARPVASPGVVAELVSALPSDTVAAPRNLSGSLRRKLDMIASQHQGHVPLHGRLFSLWLHHAFPNECPSPPASDAGAPMTHEEWQEAMQEDSTASEEEMQRVKALAESAQSASRPRDFHESALQWSEEEELVSVLDVASLGSQADGHGPWAEALRCLLRFAAMATATVATLATFWDSLCLFAWQVCPRRMKGDAFSGSLPSSFSPGGGGPGARSKVI